MQEHKLLIFAGIGIAYLLACLIALPLVWKDVTPNIGYIFGGILALLALIGRFPGNPKPKGRGTRHRRKPPIASKPE